MGNRKQNNELFYFDRILAQIAPDASGNATGSSCWVYTGKLNTFGYGFAYCPVLGQQVWMVHRLIWTIRKGPIPPKMQLDHRCYNRACANPDHLEMTTQAENLNRRRNPGRKPGSRNKSTVKETMRERLQRGLSKKPQRVLHQSWTTQEMRQELIDQHHARWGKAPAPEVQANQFILEVNELLRKAPSAMQKEMVAYHMKRLSKK